MSRYSKVESMLQPSRKYTLHPAHTWSCMDYPTRSGLFSRPFNISGDQYVALISPNNGSPSKTRGIAKRSILCVNPANCAPRELVDQ